MRKKYISGLVAGLLAAAGFVAISPTAHAANLPTVRLVSPTINPANETFAADGLGQWYAAGGHSYFTYVGAGSTITLTYLVTSDGTAPAADKTINLMVNAPYSGSKATWEVDGKKVGASQDSGTGYGLLVTGKTNSEGKVSFTIKNTDDKSVAEPLPTSETQPRLATGRLYGNMKAFIDGLNDMQQEIDMVTFDITKADAQVIPTPVKVFPSMRLISPAYTEANSVDTTADIAQWYSAKTKAWYTYAAAGSTLTLKYKVTKDGTAPLANTEVTLQVNAPYSGSKAHWTSGSTKIGIPSADSASGADLKGTTNAAGEVTFVLTNTDTTGSEAAPKTPNAKIPATRLYGTLKPIIPGYGDKDADVDLVTFDIYTAPKPVAKATTITCVKGKLVKKVTAVNPKCPTGYTKK